MRMQIRTKIVIAAAVVAVAVVVAFLLLKGQGKEEPKAKVRNAPKAERGNGAVKSTRKPYLTQKNAATSAVKYPTKSTGNKKRPGGMKAGRIGGTGDEVYTDSDGKPYPPADQKIMAAADAAIENDDLEGARSLAEAALKSDNADLKEKVVEALGWFGEAAMAELTPFMSDANEEVAKAATDNWVDALQNMDDDGVKAGVVEMSLKSIRNKDILEVVADELVGLDDHLAAVQAIANVMEGDSSPAAEAAREAYETITGEKWSGVDAAEKWLQENYKPPEDDK